MTQLLDIFARLLHFDLLVTRDDTKAGAGSVEETSVKLGEYFGKLAAILVAHDHVRDAETVAVCIQTLETLLLDVVCNQDACVLHQLGDIGRLAAWCSGHVQYSLTRLGGQRHYWQERARTLEDVMTREVLGRCTDGNLRLVNLESNL